MKKIKIVFFILLSMLINSNIFALEFIEQVNPEDQVSKDRGDILQIEWEDCPDYNRYELWLSPDSIFKAFLIKIPILGNHQHNLDTSILDSRITKCFWRMPVSACSLRWTA